MPRVPPPVPVVSVWPFPAWATANAWDGALLLDSDRCFSTRISPSSNSARSQSPLIASTDVSFGNRGVKLFITTRLISRADVVILYLSSFMMRMMFTRAKYSETVLLYSIWRVSNSHFALSCASSSVSAAIFFNARHATEGEPISITIFMTSCSFSSAFVRDCHTNNELSTNARLHKRSSSARGTPDVLIDNSESSAESQPVTLAHV